MNMVDKGSIACLLVVVVSFQQAEAIHHPSLLISKVTEYQQYLLTFLPVASQHQLQEYGLLQVLVRIF